MDEQQPFGLPPEILGQVPLFKELAKVLSWQGGPVNWDLARQVGIATAAAGHSVRLAEDAAGEAAEHLRLAERWLLDATGLPEPATMLRPQALTPAAWAERAAGTYRELIDPLARRIADALIEQPFDPELSPQQHQMLGGALRQMAPLLLGVQTGMVLGTVAREVQCGYDLPLPVADEGTAVVIPPAIERAAAAYDLDQREATLWVCLHEAAHRLQYEALPWVRAHFFSLYHGYVSSLQFDLQGILGRIEQMDITDPARLQEALGDGGLVGLVDSPAVEETLGRLHVFLAVLEGYAARAMEGAAERRLPAASRIAEAAARRRAGETRGEELLRQFLGIDLRGRRRAADRLTREAIAQGGFPLLNRLWDDPGMWPAAEELREPSRWIARVRGSASG